MDMIIDVSDAGFSYDRHTMVFSKISFSLHKHEIFCILGPNGIGKSTLIRCLANLHPLCTGSVRLAGKDLTTLRRNEAAREIGYVPQTHQVAFPFSVLDFVLMGRAPHLGTFSSPGCDDYEKAHEIIEMVGISGIMEREVNQISGGEFQLAMIARALTQEPGILLLDEPTSHLDFGNQIRVLDIIDRLARDGVSVIMTSHFPDHAFLASTRVAIMQHGSFMSYGTARDVITEENLKETYGIDVIIDYCTGAARHVCIPLKSGDSRSGEKTGKCYTDLPEKVCFSGR